jgi:hypothetical protein
MIPTTQDRRSSKGALKNILKQEAIDRSNDRAPVFQWKNGETIDPEATGYMIGVNNSIKKNIDVGIRPISADLSLDKDFALALRKAYYPIRSISGLSPQLEKISAISNTVQIATSDLPVAASLFVQEGDAGMGRPLVFTAVEKKLQIEPSLLRDYDIYWLQLTINPSEELVDRSMELRYDVTIDTPNCLVMAIVPLRIGVEASNTDK